MTAALLARYDIEKAARTLTKKSLAERRTGGLWRWAELLPVRDKSNVVYLGEGIRRSCRSYGSGRCSASRASPPRPKA